MLKLLGNHVKTLLIQAKFLKTLIKKCQKCQKSDFLAKNHVFALYSQNFQKYYLIFKNLKKKPDLNNMTFKELALLTHI